jgi:hypothetical protein
MLDGNIKFNKFNIIKKYKKLFQIFRKLKKID